MIFIITIIILLSWIILLGFFFNEYYNYEHYHEYYNYDYIITLQL